MGFSQGMKESISQFAKEQSRHYLQEAEMTYLEKLRSKTGQARNKVKAKLAKFKNRSETSLEAQNDMILYMGDYMNDLMAQGISEQEAFQRAKEELAFRSETVQSSDLLDRFSQYYENRSPADYEAIGLFYAGFMFFGGAVGGLIGFLGSGGREQFLSAGWVDTLIGVGTGFFIGMGLGLISNAIIVLKNK